MRMKNDNFLDGTIIVYLYTERQLLDIDLFVKCNRVFYPVAVKNNT
jgi:hypothetical protein